MILFIVPGRINDFVLFIGFKKIIDFKLRKIIMINLCTRVMCEYYCIHDLFLVINLSNPFVVRFWPYIGSIFSESAPE